MDELSREEEEYLEEQTEAFRNHLRKALTERRASAHRSRKIFRLAVEQGKQRKREWDALPLAERLKSMSGIKVDGHLKGKKQRIEIFVDWAGWRDKEVMKEILRLQEETDLPRAYRYGPDIPKKISDELKKRGLKLSESSIRKADDNRNANRRK